MTEKSQETYFVNAELIEEMVRLMRQANLVTEAMGGVLPDQDEQTLAGIRDVLDLACGPGEWVMQVASEHPNFRVSGVDKSRRMIAFASVQAEADEGPGNVHFREMDITQPLVFDDASFDLVNIRFILTFMKREQWPLLLAECFRILRPGGTLRVTEQETGFSTSLIYQRYMDLWGKAWIKVGHGFAHTPSSIGVTVMLKDLMRESGFTGPKHRPISIDLSTAEAIHKPMMENLIEALRLGAPFLLKWEVASQEFLDQLYEDMQTLINKPRFEAFWLLQSVWAKKPGVGSQ